MFRSTTVGNTKSTDWSTVGKKACKQLVTRLYSWQHQVGNETRPVYQWPCVCADLHIQDISAMSCLTPWYIHCSSHAGVCFPGRLWLRGQDLTQRWFSNVLVPDRIESLMSCSCHYVPHLANRHAPTCCERLDMFALGWTTKRQQHRCKEWCLGLGTGCIRT